MLASVASFLAKGLAATRSPSEDEGVVAIGGAKVATGVGAGGCDD